MKYSVFITQKKNKTKEQVMQCSGYPCKNSLTVYFCCRWNKKIFKFEGYRYRPYSVNELDIFERPIGVN